MFVVQTRFRRNPKHFFNDKRLPMGNKSERLVNPFLERVCNPKGSLAYKYFSIMQTEKQSVVLPQVVTTQSISQFLGHKVSNLKVVFTPKKVSISCRAYQHSFGAKGKTLTEAVYYLSERIRLDRYFA